MSDLISRNALANAMYHETFEKDTDMQKWDNGCWIRYKLFENVLRDMPSADTVEVVRCGECKHMTNDGRCLEFADDCLRPSASDYCSYGERKDG